MKHPFTYKILPLFTMGVGGLGLALRLWLFSAIDGRGLLPRSHPAQTLLYILSALVIGALFLATRQPGPRRDPARWMSALAYALAGAGLALTAFSSHTGGVIRLENMAKAVCLIGGGVLLLQALLTALSKPIPYWLSALLTGMLMINTVAQCQIWGSVPQLQEFFFPLMASVFLLLTAYHKTALLAGQPSSKKLAFFSQCALFFCCTSLNDAQWPLYLGMLFWCAVQLPSCPQPEKEA